METTFYLKKTAGNKEGIVYFLFSVDYSKIKISSKEKCLVTEWGRGFPKQIAKTKGLRNRLSSYKEQIDHFITRSIKEQQRKPSKEELYNEINHIINGTTSDKLKLTIKELVNIFINEQKIELHSNTIRYKEIHLKHFISAIHGERKTLVDLTHEVLSKYKNILISEKREDSTTNNYIKTIKSFLNWLFTKKYIDKPIANDLKKLKEIQKEVIALNDEEMTILENSALIPHLQNQIDIFLLGCYTALGISDIKRIKKEIVIDGFLKIRREKTQQILSIPLLDEAIEILEKYNYQLPVISDNKGNENLKLAFAKLKLDRPVRISKKINNKVTDQIVPLHEVISWHKSRKTAITQAIKRGIPISLVMQLSGHNKYESMKKYISAVNHELEQEMKAKLSRSARALKIAN